MRRPLVLVVLLVLPLLPPAHAAGDEPKVTTEYTFPDATTARVDVTILYDTDTTRVGSYRLPPGFETDRVRDDSGRLDFDTRGSPTTGQIVEFEPSYEPGDGFQEVEITASRATDVQDLTRRLIGVVGEGSFFFVAYSLAYEDWRTELVVRAPSKGRMWVSTSDLGIEEVRAGRPWHRARDELVEVTVFVVFDATKADLVAERVGNYTVLEPRAWAGTPASDTLETAVREADAFWPGLVEMRGRGPSRDGGLLVVFAGDDLFTSEEGFYQAGIVAMRRASVENGTSLAVAETLVHETMHGFLDDIAWLREEGRWMNEGTARWAEYRFEAGRTDLVDCRGRACVNLTHRLTVDELERYESSTDVPAWSRSVPSSSDGYGEAAYVLEAFADREGLGAWRRLLTDLRTYPLDDECDIACVLAEGIVPGHEDGDASAFFHPNARLAGEEGFASAVAAFAVAERTFLLPAAEPPREELPEEAPEKETDEDETTEGPAEEAPEEIPETPPSERTPDAAPKPAPVRVEGGKDTPLPAWLAVAAAALAAARAKRSRS